MDNMNPNQLIVTEAWNMLWNKKKYPDYYLPDVIMNGIKAAGVTVDPLGNLDFDTLGPYSLFNDSNLGSISLEFTENIVGGLNTMCNKGIVVPPDGLSFTATVGVTALTGSGHFNVLATGLSTCAIDSAWLLGEFGASASYTDGTGAANPDDSTGIQAAKSYREKLLAQGENGMLLVAAYYDNNEVYNQVVNDINTSFNFYWGYVKTDGYDAAGKQVTVTSKILSEETTAAANDPSSQTSLVGYHAYNLHSYICQGLMLNSIKPYITSLQSQYTGKTIPASVQAQIDRYQKALNATFVFGNNTKPINNKNQNGMNVNAVMDVVKTSTPVKSSTMGERVKAGQSLSEAAKDEDFPLYQEAMRRADELTEAFERDKAAGTLRSSKESSTPVSGSYSLSIAVPTMAFSGTISSSGEKITVSITQINADLPSLIYTLTPIDPGSALFTRVLTYYNTAEYIHILASKKTNEALNSKNVLDYISERINQAIAKIFG